MSQSSTIILVEDDIEIGELISKYLSKYEINVTVLRDGLTLDKLIETQTYDLIILDVNLPGEDGLSICRRIRSKHAIPIIFLTARSEDIDKILGLEMGADDYLVKPFADEELLARARTLMRRASSAPHPVVILAGDIEIRIKARTVHQIGRAHV